MDINEFIKQATAAAAANPEWREQMQLAQTLMTEVQKDLVRSLQAAIRGNVSEAAAHVRRAAASLRTMADQADKAADELERASGL